MGTELFCCRRLDVILAGYSVARLLGLQGLAWDVDSMSQSKTSTAIAVCHEPKTH